MASDKIGKVDLIEAVYQDTKIERQIVQKVAESLFESIKESIISGKTIELRGFGTFEPRLRKGRENARNPKTGASVSTEPHYVAAFRAGRDFKNSMKKLSVEDSGK